VYLRRSSGERLCPRCLEHSLVRKAKRTLSRTRSIGPRDRILIPVLEPWMAKSVALLRIVSIVEEPYPSQLLVVLDEAGVERLSDIEGMMAKPASFYRIEARGLRSIVEGGSLLRCLRVLRAVAVESARRLGAGLVMMPPARDFFVVLMLSSMLRGDVGGMMEHRSMVEVGGVRVAYPFYDVECEDIAMYQHVIGVDEWLSGDAGCMDRLDKQVAFMVAELAGRGRELLFSAQNTLRLLRRVGGGLVKCPYCGGLGEESPCRICREAGAEEIIRSLRVGPLT